MSKIEVDAIDKQSGSTLTLGGSGTAVTLASGATQSGFGRTGSVNWQTTKKTANFTATSGEGYFCDTAASGAFTLTLPSSPSAGDIVGLKDYNGNFSIANLTIGRGGSNLSGSGTDKILDTNNLSLTLVYVDATEGWVPIEEGTGFIGENFIVATGGTITTSGNCKIHTFTGSGTFTVSQVATCAANNIVSHVVVAGGAGGGGFGGGGAGGYREVKNPVTPYTASPLDGYSTPANRVTVTATAFPITVGGGGSGSPRGCSGSNSVFSTITSAGGGGGGGFGPSIASGNPGGSGGGGGSPNSSPYPGQAGGTGNQPPVSPAQGSNGGCGVNGAAAGGGAGGATAVGIGGGGTPAPNVGGNGGAGATTSINATPTAFAGGGGGAGGTTGGTGGAGGAGNGGTSPNSPGAVAGTANTGGGGGGKYTGAGAAGGSGIVIIRYKFQ